MHKQNLYRANIYNTSNGNVPFLFLSFFLSFLLSFFLFLLLLFLLLLLLLLPFLEENGKAGGWHSTGERVVEIFISHRPDHICGLSKLALAAIPAVTTPAISAQIVFYLLLDLFMVLLSTDAGIERYHLVSFSSSLLLLLCRIVPGVTALSQSAFRCNFSADLMRPQKSFNRISAAKEIQRNSVEQFRNRIN